MRRPTNREGRRRVAGSWGVLAGIDQPFFTAVGHPRAAACRVTPDDDLLRARVVEVCVHVQVGEGVPGLDAAIAAEQEPPLIPDAPTVGRGPVATADHVGGSPVIR